MKKWILPILILTGMHCSNPVQKLESLKPGQAEVIIDKIKYDACTEMDHQMLVDTDFEKIILHINDSVRVEILNPYFTEGETIWSREDHFSQNTIFSLQYYYLGGGLYFPVEGWFSIENRNPESIQGGFDLTVQDGASSCMYCPGTMKDISGKFHVEILNN